jgi:hypothetical protein
MSERRDVTIQVPIIKANTRAPAEFIQHACPLCGGVFDWAAFQAHAAQCIADHPERVREIRGEGQP